VLPSCRGAVRSCRRTGLECVSLPRIYPILDGIPVMLVEIQAPLTVS
jgi:uncharacterized protein YbaR (Trm112 family)